MLAKWVKHKIKGMALDGRFSPSLQVCSDRCVHMTAFWTLNGIMQFPESHKELERLIF